MAKIVDLNPNRNNVKEVLDIVLNEAEGAKEICILLKDKNNDTFLFYSDTLSLQDKSFFATMLQHDVYTSLDLESEIQFEPDM